MIFPLMLLSVNQLLTLLDIIMPIYLISRYISFIKMTKEKATHNIWGRGVKRLEKGEKGGETCREVGKGER